MFGRKKAAPRTCPQGHPQEPSWEQCPFCAAGNGGAEATVGRVDADGERPADPGEGAVVVPRKIAPSRALAGWVVVLTGEDTDKDHRLHGGPNVLGKGADCDVIVRDAHVSQRHAVIHCREDGYLLEDLDSKHGTQLDGTDVSGRQPISDGARIRVGGTELRFRSFSR